MPTPAPSAPPAPRVALASRTAVGLFRWVLVLVGTPLLVFPFAWAAWVAFVLWASSRLRGTDTLLRWLGRPRPIAVEAGRASVDGEAPRAVLGGWVEPWAWGLAVVLDLAGRRRLIVEVRDHDEGRRLLERAGVGADQQVFRVALGSHAVLSGQGVVFHLLGPLLLALMALGPALSLFKILGRVRRTGEGWADLVGSSGVLLALLAVGLGLAWLLVPGEASVGRDGVALRRLWNRRFFPFQRVHAVISTEHGVSLSTDQGTIQLPTATFFANDQGPREALARRIQDAMEAWAAADRPEQPLPLDRRGLAVAAWRQSLAAALQGASYRRDSVDHHDLLRLLEAPSSPLEQRVGAALALGATPLPPAERARVRAAVDSSAHEPSRLALQHALDGDLDDALLDAAISADADARRARGP